MKESFSAVKLKALILKDIKVEIRTRYALNTLLMFALVTLFTLGISFINTRFDSGTHSALLWIMIYFAGLQGLSSGFVREEEANTAMTLRFYSPSNIVFMGKFIYSLMILMLLVIILFPLYYVLMNLTIAKPGLLLLVLFLGVLGMSAASTLTSVMVSRASARGALFAVLSFPIMLPLLLTVISATSICIGDGDMTRLWDNLKILISYPVILVAISYLLFDQIWRS